MKLIKITETGLCKFDNNLDAVAGNVLADMLEVRHDNIMRTIKKVIKYENERSFDSSQKRSEIIHIEEESSLKFNAIFKEWEYQNSRGRTYKTYVMNEDALYLVVANTQSKKAHQLKVWFKSEFNKMKIERDKRESIKVSTKNTQKLMIELRDKLAKEYPQSNASKFMMSNIQNNINKCVTGKYATIDRELLNQKELDLLNEIEEITADYLEGALSFDKDSKKMLEMINFMLKFISSPEPDKIKSIE